MEKGLMRTRFLTVIVFSMFGVCVASCFYSVSFAEVSFAEVLVTEDSVAEDSVTEDSVAQDRGSFFREDFKDLSSWKEQPFPSVDKRTQFSIVSDSVVGDSVVGNSGEGEPTTLKIESDSGASALVLQKDFNPRKYPVIRWRWKTETVYKDLDPDSKDGDDYPLRVYVIFPYESERVSFFEKAAFSAARLRYGEYPPIGTLNYVWGHQSQKTGSCFDSPFTDRAKLRALQNNPSKEWITESVNVAEDYRRCFKDSLPDKARLAVMGDSDNSKKSSKGFIGFIEIGNW